MNKVMVLSLIKLLRKVSERTVFSCSRFNFCISECDCLHIFFTYLICPPAPNDRVQGWQLFSFLKLRMEGPVHYTINPKGQKVPWWFLKTSNVWLPKEAGNILRNFICLHSVIILFPRRTMYDLTDCKSCSFFPSYCWFHFLRNLMITVPSLVLHRPCCLMWLRNS